MENQSNTNTNWHNYFTGLTCYCFDYLFDNENSSSSSNSSSARPSTPNGKKKTSCFAAIRINDEDVVQNVEVLQELIRAEEPASSQFMMDPSRLHITVLSRIQIDLNDEADIRKAKTTLENAVQQHQMESIDCEVDVDILGVTTFYGSESEGKVIVSAVEGETMNAQLKSLHDCVDKEFKAMSMLSDTAAMNGAPIFPYVAHITIGIVPANNDYKFPESSWKEFEDMSFGTHQLTIIDILTRNADPNQEGYRCIASVPLYDYSDSDAEE